MQHAVGYWNLYGAPNSTEQLAISVTPAMPTAPALNPPAHGGVLLQQLAHFDGLARSARAVLFQAIALAALLAPAAVGGAASAPAADTVADIWVHGAGRRGAARPCSNQARDVRLEQVRITKAGQGLNAVEQQLRVPPKRQLPQGAGGGSSGYP